MWQVDVPEERKKLTLTLATSIPGQPAAPEREKPRSFLPLEGFPPIPMSVEEFQLLMPEITGKNLSGVGLLPLFSMERNHETGDMVIITPVRNSPAAQAGLHAGDILESVSGVKVHDLTLPALMDLLRGDAGTPVPIAVRRGETVIPLELMRRNIPARDAVVVPEVLRPYMGGLTEIAKNQS